MVRFLAVAMTFANPLLHKAVSDVADWASARWGFATYDRAALVSIPLMSVIVLAGALFARRGVAARGAGISFSLIVLTAVTIAAQHWLLVANIELIHLPQFALLAALWLAGGFDRPSAFLAASAGGAIDETYQHLVVYAGRPDTYFDINDIVLNAIGAAWAVVVLGTVIGRDDAEAIRNRPRALWVNWLTAPRFFAAAVVCLGIAVWLDPPVFDPLLKPTAGGRSFYRVLSAPEGTIVLLMLFGMVLAPTRRDRSRARLLGSRVTAVLPACVAFTLFSSACASAPARATTPAALTATAPGAIPFITTFWCGPPLEVFDDARAAEIAAAGFTVVGPPCEGESSPERNRSALDVAARHGLKLWISDFRFNEQARTIPNWETAIAEAAASYKDHAAFGGYFVTDEPSAQQFEDLAAIVARLREIDPQGLVYLNLLADYVPDGFGTVTYREYVERFITTVRPSILSYDYYPFGVAADRPSFFSNLSLVRDIAQKHALPFMLILLAMPHGPYRDPTEAELSWQALHALSYGARGISYFAYWTPVNVKYADVQRFRRGLIEAGRPTEHYFEATRLNRTARAIARQLDSYRSVSVADSIGEVAPPLPLGPIASIEGAPITAGLFADDAGHRAVLVVNRDYRRAVTIRLRLVPGTGRPERFSAETGAWIGSGETLPLAAGGAQFLRWSGR